MDEEIDEYEIDLDGVNIDETGSHLDGHCYHLMFMEILNEGRKIHIKLLSCPNDLENSLKNSEGLVVTRSQYEEMRIKRTDFDNDPFLEREQFSDKEIGRIRIYSPLILNSYYDGYF